MREGNPGGAGADDAQVGIYQRPGVGLSEIADHSTRLQQNGQSAGLNFSPREHPAVDHDESSPACILAPEPGKEAAEAERADRLSRQQIVGQPKGLSLSVGVRRQISATNGAGGLKIAERLTKKSSKPCTWGTNRALNNTASQRGAWRGCHATQENGRQEEGASST